MKREPACYAIDYPNIKQSQKDKISVSELSPKKIFEKETI